jgi:ubiquitin-activating enzyme E1
VITEVIQKSLADKINTVTRENDKGFIYSSALGISGFAFLDYGNSFKVNDANGEPLKTYLCKTIYKENPGVVMIDDSIGTGKLTLQDDDYVTFREVEGMVELNDKKPRKIKYIGPVEFTIEDTTGYSDYVSGGIIEQVKLPITISFKSFVNSLSDPYNQKVNDPIDFSKFGRNEMLHACTNALFDYFDTTNELPELNNDEQVQICVSLAKNIIGTSKSDWAKNCEEFNENVASNFFRWARSQITGVTAFLGGVVAQEIVKYTGKYSPLNQWLWFEFGETTKELPVVNRKLQNSRYDDQTAIYGQETTEKLANYNLFMIGAGALGCEFLKNFALMGISTNSGITKVTDNDNIEVSNLNRQFLFRMDNVGGGPNRPNVSLGKALPHLYILHRK